MPPRMSLRSIHSRLDLEIKKRPNLKKILANMGWLSFDRLFQLFISFAVIIWVIRYLGPEQFGLLSYSWAFAGLFGAFTFSCVGSVLLRDLIKFDKKQNELLGTSFVIMLSGGVVCFFVSILASLILDSSNWFLAALVGISAFSFMLNAFNVIDYWFQSKVLSKYVVLSRNLMLIAVSIIKIIFMIVNAPLIFFALASLFEVILFVAGLLYFYVSKGQSILNWRFNPRLAKALIMESWPLVFSGLAIMVYMRIDQIMLGQMLDMTTVGIYSVAVKLSEFVNFIPGIIIGSILPSIVLVKSRDDKIYQFRFGLLYKILFAISLCITLLIVLFSPQIIYLLYGEEYISAVPILFVYAWSMIPLFFSFALNQYFIIEKKVKYSFYTSVIGAFLNVLLNLALIPVYGPVGAAVATVVAYSLSVLSVFLFNQTRKHGWLMLQGLDVIGSAKYFISKLR